MTPFRKAVQIVAPVLVAMTFSSCIHTTPEPKANVFSAVAFEEGVPGGVMARSMTLTASVVDVDKANRAVTLKTSDGQTSQVKCGPQVVNFDQIEVGDQLSMVVAEELVVAMAKEGTESSDGGAALLARAPDGAKPAGLVAGTAQATATVTAIDLKNHKATLQFADGSSKTIRVREDVDLTQRKIGEKVVIRKTEALAVAVEEI